MSREPDTDPIEQLTHDHGQLSALAQTAAGALARMERAEEMSEEALDELVHAVESLRDSLLAHFAREEEGLFPFVDAQVPALAPQVAGLLADHDAVIARTDDLIRAAGQAASTGVGYALCVSTYDRFVEVYAGHAQAEQALLRAVDAALDAEARKALRALLQAI
ncbi:MAG TPA: hemerythrin domain-containing protein [Labilithrix sp.]|nr:hemerythrin domain-containing protein [Labilithrix sp.]